jgi:hypothetical protein
LEFILLLVGQLAKVAFVFCEHVGCGAAFADDLGEEEFVEAEDVEAGHL